MRNIVSKTPQSLNTIIQLMSLPPNTHRKIYFKRNKSFSSQLEDSLALTHIRRFSSAESNRRIFLIFLIGGKKTLSFK